MYRYRGYKIPGESTKVIIYLLSEIGVRLTQDDLHDLAKRSPPP